MSARVIIIAEAGVNHNGSLEMAKKLIDVAADAGADYVKFQTFKADKLVSRKAKKAEYQEKNINDGDDSQYNMLKKLELSDVMHTELIEYCTFRNIKFLSSGFDEESIDYLDSLGIDLFKIPSGEITNKPYLQHIARKGKAIVLSTGMADLEEIRDALNVMYAESLKPEQITILHCNTEYPTPMEDVNLLAMNTIREALDVSVGYSDHTCGIEVPIAAVALGAKVIEKHFTLDRSLPGPDHKASLEPEELKAMVDAIRNIEIAISGSGEKIPSKSEFKNRDIARKSLHALHFIASGKQLSADDLVILRPGNGISPMQIEDVIGKITKFDLAESSILRWEDLK
jgi:N,N'-diacetyllegionaminate synthase